MFRKFNHWYDHLDPTPRFLLFLVLVAPAGAVLQLGFNLHSKLITLLGGIWFLLVLLIAPGRAMPRASDNVLHRALVVIMLAGGVFVVTMMASALL